MTNLLLYLKDADEDGLVLPTNLPEDPVVRVARPRRSRAVRALKAVARRSSLARYMARVHGARTPDGGAH